MKHVYGKKISVKVFYLVFLGLALFYGYKAWTQPPENSTRTMQLAIAAGLLVPALGFVAYGFTAHVAISNEAVETGSLFRRRSLPLNQISHRREYQKDAGDDYIVRYIEFIPKSVPKSAPNAPRERPLKIATNHFDFDSEFRRFVEQFPEADPPQTRANHSRAGGRS